jgi:hypothetical protein
MQPFSKGPFPNRASTFQCTRLSRQRPRYCVALCTLRYSRVPVSLALCPFPLSQTLLRAVEYYGHSVAMRVAPGRRSRSSSHILVCP